MAKKNHFQISTAIDYPSGKPHLGHTYEKIIADVLARWNRLKGNKVHFSTGLDCHGSKIERYAEKNNQTPKNFVKSMEPYFLRLCKDYNISYDDFIKTTEIRHSRVAKKFIEELNEKGDIYKGVYTGNYCSDCETYFSKEELIDGANCPTHNKPTEILKEKSYFFKMSKYQDKIIEHIKSNPKFILPKERRNEILNRLKEPLKDLSLTREKVKWGISFPLDENLIIAIWSEALLNYLTTVKYPSEKYQSFWPALHIIGLDITWHHTVIWGSMLMALGIELPNVFVHGFIRSSTGEKMSKSLGNVVNPLSLVDNYPTDAIRYYLIREIPLGQDGDFSEDAVVSRLNNELANDLGNLVSRVSTLTEKNFKEGISKTELDEELVSKLDFKKIESFIEKIELHNALSEIWKFVNECNKYVNEKEIWHLKGKELNKSLYTLLESIRVLSLVLTPFLPETASKISSHLGQENKSFENVKFGLVESYLISKSEVLFKKIEIKKKQEENKLAFEDLNLRVAKVKEVKDHPNADKLYLLNLDLGGQELNIVSGLKQHYKKEELVEKNIIVIANLERSTIRGVESEGMLLAAEENSKLSLLTSKDIPGSKVFVKKSSYKEKELVKFKEFKSFKFITKEGKVYYNGLPLKTDKEEIGLDKEMSDGLTVE